MRRTLNAGTRGEGRVPRPSKSGLGGGGERSMLQRILMAFAITFVLATMTIMPALTDDVNKEPGALPQADAATGPGDRSAPPSKTLGPPYGFVYAYTKAGERPYGGTLTHHLNPDGVIIGGGDGEVAEWRGTVNISLNRLLMGHEFFDYQLTTPVYIPDPKNLPNQSIYVVVEKKRDTSGPIAITAGTTILLGPKAGLVAATLSATLLPPSYYNRIKVTRSVSLRHDPVRKYSVSTSSYSNNYWRNYRYTVINSSADVEGDFAGDHFHAGRKSHRHKSSWGSYTGSLHPSP